MAPTTRLRDKPSLRVNYYASQNRGTREHPFVISDEGSRVNPFIISDSPERKPYTRKSGPLTRSAGIARVKAPVRTLKLKRKLDCDICGHSRSDTHFPTEKGVKACKHLEKVCVHCIGKLIKGMVHDRKLGKAELNCLEPGCQHILSFADVKNIVRKDTFETWDAALVQHQLRASDQYIACLNATCGHHFSIEDCSKKTSRKKKIACPYCEYGLCMDCNRPWHAKTGCDKNKTADDEKSVAAIKTLGAKPCPKCGVNIDKVAGCDHMTCNQCGHHFCWRCSVTYSATMKHAEGCVHGQRNIAMDPGNFYNGPMNGIANFLAGIAHGPAPAPAARPAAQDPIQEVPAIQMPAQNVHGFNAWGINAAMQQLQAHIQGLIGDRDPDNAAPARQPLAELPIPPPVLRPIAGNAPPQPHINRVDRGNPVDGEQHGNVNITRQPIAGGARRRFPLRRRAG